jgi:hypothetical protein
VNRVAFGISSASLVYRAAQLVGTAIVVVVVIVGLPASSR